MKVTLQVVASALFSVVFFGAALFLPAGTVDYWQAWLFIAVFVACTTVPSSYLAVRSPDALARRMKAGPTAETRPAQRIIISVTAVLVVAAMVVSALDWRFGWSTVPAWAVIVAQMLVAGGLLGAQWVVVQNNYAGATITVEAGQPLVSTGWYGVVRHPMYSTAAVMLAATPPALGSLWGLPVAALALPALAARILDEERALTEQLAGYREYKDQVRYRLIPRVW